jgi:hypothetical protein
MLPRPSGMSKPQPDSSPMQASEKKRYVVKFLISVNLPVI